MMKSKIFQKDVISFVFLMVVFIINIPSQYLQSFQNIRNVYKILQVIMLLITLLHLRKISKIFIVISFYYIIYAISTFLNNNGTINPIINSYIIAINLIVISEYYIKENSKVYFSAASKYFQIILTINFFTILLFPNGIYIGNNNNPHFFLGQRNDTIEFILPALLFTFIDNIIREKSKLILNLLSIVSILTVLITWSANSIVAIVITLGYIWLPTKKVMQNIMGYYHWFLSSCSIFFLFVVFKFQKLFEWFITGVLHKSLTFTSRTIIWDKAIYYIKKSLLIGYGNETEIIKYYKIRHGNSCHNYFLDFLYVGGITMLVTILIMVLMVGKKMSKKLKNLKLSKIQKIFIGVFAGYFVIWFATPIHLRTIGYMFLIFSLAYNIENIKIKENNYERKNENNII